MHVMVQIDTTVFQAVNAAHSAVADWIFLLASSRWLGLFFGLALAAGIGWRYRWAALPVVVAASLAVAVTDTIGAKVFKPWIGRVRPCYALPPGTFRQLAAAADVGAMPSLHAANAALGLAPHLHAIATDGVFVQSKPETRPVFHALPAPSKAEVAAVAWSTCERTVRLLKQRGLWCDADSSADRLAQEQPLLATLAKASLSGVLAMGPNAGQRPMRLFARAARAADERYEKAPKNAYGFDLHAGARAAADDRLGRERLCRYLLRPPLSNDRLTRTADGKYRIALKRVWDDGTVAIVVSGEELLARLAVLVPPPRVHTTRYFGVFAPRAKMRRLVVPQSPPDRTPRLAGDDCADDDRAPHSHRYRLSWAQALAKVFEVDLLECPRCRQKGMQQIAVIHDAVVLRALLASMAKAGKPP